MRGFAQSGPEETRHINKWLADNCFGDYYTRGGLDTREREMVTLCFLPRRVVANRSLRRMPRRIWSLAMRRRF